MREGDGRREVEREGRREERGNEGKGREREGMQEGEWLLPEIEGHSNGSCPPLPRSLPSWFDTVVSTS